jgi:methionyl aminopeptidase
VVHGVPNERVLKEGDLLKLDTACRLEGWCADRAITLPIGTVRPERLRLLRVAEETLQMAINEMPRKRWWGEVASMMQQHTEKAGFRMVTNYVGHGIGRVMHENPQVPNYVNRDTRKNDFRLEPGLVLAVEPMLNMGSPDVVTKPDHWTVVTRDGLPSVHVEHTLAIKGDGTVMVITSDDGAW